MRENVAAVILAAGKSTRMRELSGEAPKVLLPIHGKPMIEHLLESIEKSGVASSIVVVTGPDADSHIRKALAEYKLTYALQPAQLGTGHAVLCSRHQIPEDA
ncbi:MAG: NTP transferase domain-containing protein, partial [bacterium]